MDKIKLTGDTPISVDIDLSKSEQVGKSFQISEQRSSQLARQIATAMGSSNVNERDAIEYLAGIAENTYELVYICIQIGRIREGQDTGKLTRE